MEREGCALGLLPFYVYRDEESRERQLLPLGVGTSDYLDGVFAPECSEEEILRGVEWLRGQVRHDVLSVTQLPGRSRLLAAFRDTRREDVSDAVPCSRMKAVTMAELPQRIRRNAMYYRNRAQRRGALELVQADAASWEKIFSELVRLHTSRWRRRGEDGVLVDERVVAWHREAIPQLLDAGLLRLMALRLNEETIAVLYSLVDQVRERRTQYFYITAYSPEYADLRPGTLLIAFAAEHAAREGLTTIDMLRGDESYKQMWHMEREPTWCVTQAAASGWEENAA
jgi:CelD/BcsL family acetyltransferase involved in cellulose biosynthesis